MKGRPPTTAEKAHMNRVGKLGCIACLKDGLFNKHISLHHVDGRTKPNAHMKVLPLCAAHHQQNDTDPLKRVAVHPNKARFEEMYGTEQQLILEVIKLIKGK